MVWRGIFYLGDNKGCKVQSPTSRLPMPMNVVSTFTSKCWLQGVSEQALRRHRHKVRRCAF
jgi:hypothetical protein